MNLPQRTLGSSRVMITKTGFGAWAIGGGGWAFGWGPQDDAVSVRHDRLDKYWLHSPPPLFCGGGANCAASGHFQP